MPMPNDFSVEMQQSGCFVVVDRGQADTVAAHIAYGIELLYTEDMGRSRNAVDCRFYEPSVAR